MDGRRLRAIELQGVTNVRDLGGISVAGGRIVSSGLIYRGAALSEATPEDLAFLFGDLGIRLVVDLRCGWERDAKPDVQAPGVKNLHIPFYDADIVGIEYTEPSAGTKVIGRDVACDPIHFYRSLSNPLTVGQMAQALDAVFAHVGRGESVYVHCSGGKDRAGILALLILTVLGADRQIILEDYLLTNVSRDKNYDVTFRRFLRLADGDETRARELVESHRARPQNLEAFYQAIQQEYGGMGSFVRKQLGFDDARIERIRSLCTHI